MIFIFFFVLADVFQIFCNRYGVVCLFVLHEKKIARLIFPCPGSAPALHQPPTSPPPILQEGREDALTWQRAAEDLQPHADAPAVEPGLRVEADVPGHRGDGQLVENRDLLFTVSFEYLLMHEGGKERRLF